MTVTIEPIAVPSLKDACSNRLQGLILSDEFQIDERLPSETDPAEILISLPRF
jgi:hypothetical protein